MHILVHFPDNSTYRTFSYNGYSIGSQYFCGKGDFVVVEKTEDDSEYWLEKREEK